MSNQSIPLLTVPVTATAALTANRFVDGAGTVATAAARALGVTRSDAAIGEKAPVDVLGTTVVEASAAIAVDAAIEVAANGKAVTKAAGVTVARALQAAGAAGDLIEVLLIAN